MDEIDCLLPDPSFQFPIFLALFVHLYFPLSSSNLDCLYIKFVFLEKNVGINITILLSYSYLQLHLFNSFLLLKHLKCVKEISVCYFHICL